MDKEQRIAEAREKGACPACGRLLTGEAVGSGSRVDGLFCNLGCLAAFHEDYFNERARASRLSRN